MCLKNENFVKILRISLELYEQTAQPQLRQLSRLKSKNNSSQHSPHIWPDLTHIRHTDPRKKSKVYLPENRIFINHVEFFRKNLHSSYGIFYNLYIFKYAWKYHADINFVTNSLKMSRTESIICMSLQCYVTNWRVKINSNYLFRLSLLIIFASAFYGFY